MSDSVIVIRQSSGTEDSESLEIQREECLELASRLDDESPEILDLGVHTGFSIHSRDKDQERIDNHDGVTELIERIEEGQFDFLIAYNDTRIARDEYYSRWKRAAAIGNTEIVFVQDIEQDTLSHGVQRVVEKHIKQKRIEDSKKALRRREEKGFDHGSPPFGLSFDENGEYWVPDDDFETAMEVIRKREKGYSYPTIVEKTGVPRGTAYRTVQNKEVIEEKKEIQQE